MIHMIVSGGQTGADRAALDVGMRWGLQTGGWVPLHRRAEDGVIPARYTGLQETDSTDSSVRTELNVRDSDGTLILSHGTLTGGSLFTEQAARRLGRPSLHLDLSLTSVSAAVSLAADWVTAHCIGKLNVAGPRASGDPAIHLSTVMVLSGILARLEAVARA